MITIAAVDPEDARSRRRFTTLPGRLHPRVAPNDRTTEDALLTGRHPLSLSLSVQAFVAERDGHPVGRIALTCYPGDRTGYVGFLDCVDDRDTARALLATCADAAALAGCDRLVGPVDASFWLRYRLKVSGFENPPFFGEPLNAPYLERLLSDNGFAVTDEYVSSYYRCPPDQLPLAAFAARHAALTAAGVELRSPTRATWAADLDIVHGLLHRLYADFPVFKPLDLGVFTRLNAGMQLTLDPRFVTLASLGGAPVGFSIGAPDYGTRLTGASAPRALATIARTRARARRYVLLYLGAVPEHQGLGKALTMRFAAAAIERRVGAVGALVHRGKVTEHYLADLVEATSTHVLMRRDL